MVDQEKLAPYLYPEAFKFYYGKKDVSKFNTRVIIPMKDFKPDLSGFGKDDL